MTDPLRILYFAWADSAHTHRWASGMAQRGYQIEVLSVGGENIRDVPTTILPYTSKLVYFHTLATVMQHLRKVRPDFVHIHSISGFSVWSLALGKIPRLISVWGSDILSAQRRLIAGYLTRKALLQADALTATSAHLASETKLLVPNLARDIEIIPFGVDVPEQTPPLPTFPPLRLCMLTSYRELYGAQLAIKAVAALRASDRQVTLTLLYPGDLKSEYDRQAGQLGITDAVSCVDPLPHEKIAEFLTGHHLLLRPSSSDSFGVSVLEAAAMGRPSIGTRIGGLTEVIQDGITGRLIEMPSVDLLEHAIRTFYDQPEQLNQFGKRAAEFVGKQYTWTRSLDMMSAMYEQMRTRVQSKR